jgi:hypothetical protein
MEEGLFEWLIIPFGLTNAPKNFMSMMDATVTHPWQL